jgi:MFS family permease
VVLPQVADEFALSPWGQGTAVSAALLGAALTAPTSGRLADRIGRRPVIVAAAVAFGTGTLASSAAPGPVSFVAGRFLVGLALGAISFAVPLYIAEISPVHRRGAMVTLNQLMLTIGLLLAYTVAYLLQPLGAWRWVLAVGLVRTRTSRRIHKGRLPGPLATRLVGRTLVVTFVTVGELTRRIARLFAAGSVAAVRRQVLVGWWLPSTGERGR